MSYLSDKLHSSPFIRLLVPFIAGIISGDTCLPEYKWLFLGASIFFSFLLLFFVTLSYRRESLFGLFLFASLYFLGFFLVCDRKYHPQPMPGKDYFAVVAEYPLEKEQSFRAIVRLAESKIKVLAYFEKSESLGKVEPGTVMWFQGQPELLQKTGNPFEFDYQAYAIRNKIGHRIFLSEENFHFLPGEQKRNIVEWSMIIRDRLLRIIERCGLKGEVLHLVSAISLGAREELEPETTQSFAKTGVIHVLAVSGLNVGIIYIVLDLMLRFMKRRKGGIILHTLVILTALWGYALITGLSPSVLRAAAMFSFIVVGRNLSRHPNIYNSLAASAFILLCFNPMLVYDVGFQLSYAAVFSIVFFHPHIYKLVFFKYWIPDQIWTLLTISVAAQIGTIPFLLHYFHQFPTWFLLANLMVIPLVTVILYLSFIVFAVAPFAPFLGEIMTRILDWAGQGMLFSVRIIERLPSPVLEGLYPSDLSMFLVVLTAVLISLFILYKRPIPLLLACITTILLLIFHNITDYQKLRQKEVVVFHVQGKSLIALTAGRETVWITAESRGTGDKLKYYMKPYEGFRGITKASMIYLPDSVSQKTNLIYCKENFLNFCGLSLCMFKDRIPENFMVDTHPYTDLVIVYGKSMAAPLDIQKFPPGVMIIDNRMPAKINTADNHPQIVSSDPGILNTAQGGAVQISFRQATQGEKNILGASYFNH